MAETTKVACMHEVSFIYYESPIGLLKIAGTEQYISEITFTDQIAGMATSSGGHTLLHQCTEQLIEYFNGKRLSFDIPIYQKGTDFQTRVWDELLLISYGKTISYLTLAKRLGNPDCIRAAASTNGKNKIAIVVPCHRVLGSNQALVGYAGGLWRKKWLLDLENKFAHGVQTLF